MTGSERKKMETNSVEEQEEDSVGYPATFSQFVAKEAVYIYHKKFMVCDNLDEGSIDDDEVYHL